MFSDLWTIIEPFPWFIVGLWDFNKIEVYVPLRHYREVRDAIERHLAKYPGEHIILKLDLL